MLDKIKEILGVEKLDESSKEEVSKFIDEMVALKATEKAQAIVEETLVEEKAKLVEEMDAKFEEYKEDTLSKFSEFVDTVIEEEVKLPEHIVEYARLGEVYKPLLEEIRSKLGVHDGSLDEEAKSLLAEAKEEIESLRDQLNSATGEVLELREDAKAMSLHIYLRKKCDGLTEAQKAKIMPLLSDCRTVTQIDEKFDLAVEYILDEKKKSKKHVEPDGDECDLGDEKGKKKADTDDKPDFLKKSKKKVDEEVLVNGVKFEDFLKEVKTTFDSQKY